jgi:Rrf2 family cysteine metabolism transcriptional repressor
LKIEKRVMKLSTKCRYGLRAALEISRVYGKVPAKRKDIAKKQGLSSSYLENILLVLRNNKIIETTRGVNGGYVLTKAPANITVYDVVSTLEGPLSIVDCVDNPSDCNKADNCVTRTVWCEVTKAVRTVLEGTTLQDLLDREKKHGAIDYSI